MCKKSEQKVSHGVTSEQREMAQDLLSGDFDNFAVVSGFFQRQPCAYLVAITKGEDGDVGVQPLAILPDEPFLEQFDKDMGDPYDHKVHRPDGISN